VWAGVCREVQEHSDLLAAVQQRESDRPVERSARPIGGARAARLPRDMLVVAARNRDIGIPGGGAA